MISDQSSLVDGEGKEGVAADNESEEEEEANSCNRTRSFTIGTLLLSMVSAWVVL